MAKLYNLGIRGKYHLFLRTLYLSSKARAFFKCNLSEKFSINRNVRQGYPLSPILFNLFINDVLDNCDKYGVYLESQYCCDGLFVNNIVLVAPQKKILRKFWKRFINGLLKMKWFLEIISVLLLLYNRLTLLKPINYKDPSFFIGNNKLPKTDN